MPSASGEKADFLVLGSGIAGLRAAIELARAGRVLVLNKGEACESATQYAQGGIAAAMGEDDEVRLHLYDTLQAGDGLCREQAVRVLVEEGPRQIQQLIDWGMRFDHNGTRLAFTREGAHSRSRVLHAHGDSTGSEILRALMCRAKKMPGIRIAHHAYAVEFVRKGDRVTGVSYLDEKTGSYNKILARATLLATGGLGQVYKETTNPLIACGDGVAMAYRAGALLSDMEFVQFHPTALAVKGAPHFLLTEAIRGEGAYLRDFLLSRFLPRYHEAAELAPRDVVSRAIVMEMQKTRSEFVYLDLTALDPERVKKRFPRVYSTCLEYNIDVTTDLVPVRPAAHYAMGGVATDLYGATTLAGLFAAGEVAATGVHGANRLASNSLLEGLVYGARAAAAMIEGRPPFVPDAGPRGAAVSNHEDHPPSAPESLEHDVVGLEKALNEVRTLMWEDVGIIRNGKDLRKALECLESIRLAKGPSLRQHHEAENILEVARVIARCALEREESRGAHYRADYPLKHDSAPPKHSYVSKCQPVYFE